MNSSGGRLNTSYINSVSNLVSNDNKNEDMNSGLFDFNNGVESLNQIFTPFSPSPFMSTYPNQFLDSPSFMFNSNFISSPPRGNYLGYDFEEEKANVSGLISQSRTSPTTISRSKMEESMKSEVQDWNDKSQPKQIDVSMQISQISKIEPESESIHSSKKDCELDPIQASKKESRFEDGYNWRKYGQKQVKGSRKPRSYFKCSYPNCPVKKKVEKDFNGYITEIIYKGKHNHPMPQNMKKRSLNSFTNTYYDHSTDKNHLESFSSYSPAYFGEADYDQDSSFSKSGNDHEYESNAKRWKTDEVESEAISYDGSNTIQEPRVVIEMKSEVDILDDGYKWRKYGQKVVKGNPNPRSYYRCTNIGCPVRKLVERASHDLESVITTYEGKHNHGLPSRGSGSYATNQPPKSNITNTSNNRTLETSTPFSDYAYSVHGMRALSNEDWVRGKFLSKTKEEPENEFIYNSF